MCIHIWSPNLSYIPTQMSARYTHQVCYNVISETFHESSWICDMKCPDRSTDNTTIHCLVPGGPLCTSVDQSPPPSLQALLLTECPSDEVHTPEASILSAETCQPWIYQHK